MENDNKNKSDEVRFTSIKNSRFFKSRTDFVRHFFKDKILKILDVGNLGDGPVNVDVRSIAKENNSEYFGLDINKNLADKMGNKNQLIGDLHDLSNVVSDGEFNCIYMGQVIEHTWQPGKIISECNRILKKDGYLVLDTPNPYDIVSIIRFFFMKKDTVGATVELTYNEAKDNFESMRIDKKQLLTQPPHKIFYTPSMLEQLLNMHGFKIEYIVFVGKPRNFIHKILLSIFKQGSQQIGVVAKKKSLDVIFNISNN